MKARHGAERRARNTGRPEADRPRSGAEALRGGAYRTLHYASAMVRPVVGGSLKPSIPIRGVSA